MKCKLLGVCQMANQRIKIIQDIPLLFMRLVLAYGFWGPAMMKWKNMDSIIEWFTTMGLPFPAINAYMAAATELVGAVLLFVGLGVRLISLPLMVVMLVAIFTVHYSHGFEAGENGFEIPLYYLLMLFTLFVYGGGKMSLSGLISRVINRS